MLKNYTWTGCFVAMALAAPAQAGGVIIDGWEADSTSKESCAVRRDNEESNNTAQEVYLLAAMLFNGHAAATETGADLDEGDDAELILDDPNIVPPTVLDEIEDQHLGGCRAAPGGLAALAGLLLFRRRRRR